jgi:preprotein translocase SecE subunit
VADDQTSEELDGGDDAALERAALASAPAASTSPGVNAPGRGPGRFLGFLRASWAELQRVQWPDRRQVGQATAVVIGFVIVAGAYLGLADTLAQRLVDFIL